MSTTASTAPIADQAPAASAPGTLTLNAAFAGVRRVPQPVNDANRTYAPASPERAELKARLKAWKPGKPKETRGTLAKYAKLVSSASEGAVTDKYL